jgi:hypothetical protein
MSNSLSAKIAKAILKDFGLKTQIDYLGGQIGVSLNEYIYQT